MKTNSNSNNNRSEEPNSNLEAITNGVILKKLHSNQHEQPASEYNYYYSYLNNDLIAADSTANTDAEDSILIASNNLEEWNWNFNEIDYDFDIEMNNELFEFDSSSFLKVSFICFSFNIFFLSQFLFVEF